LKVGGAILPNEFSKEYIIIPTIIGKFGYPSALSEKFDPRT